MSHFILVHYSLTPEIINLWSIEITNIGYLSQFITSMSLSGFHLKWDFKGRMHVILPLLMVKLTN